MSNARRDAGYSAYLNDIPLDRNKSADWWLGWSTAQDEAKEGAASYRAGEDLKGNATEAYRFGYRRAAEVDRYTDDSLDFISLS